MGLLGTRWEAKYEGHAVVVSRNEVTRGIALAWDGTEIAHRTWSWVGLGELHGTADVGGQSVEVHVKLDGGDGASKGVGTDGRCTITVNGKALEVTHVK
ncbi:MAG TPA: hypothetical protein VGG39_02895 [Polyangiaceae bacterium]|jgi:hypothetical protein